MAWKKEAIKKMMKDQLKDHLFVVVSQGEPYVHGYSKDVIKVTRGAGGVMTAFEPILKLNKGLWVALGKGAADKDVVDADDKIKMPPKDESYTLKRVFISKKNLTGWYYGLCNQALWPLCHNVFERPQFVQSEWDSYYAVNKQFADAVLKEVEGKKAVIWIQDYHFMLMAQMIKDKRPDLVVGTFWHVPWPVSDTFKIFPWSKESLEGMLGNQLIGFQRVSHCRNFLSAVANTLEAKVDMDEMTVTYNNRVTYVRQFPISIDYQAVSQASKRTKKFGKPLIKKLVSAKYDFLSFGVERLDYTKGLPERIKAIDRFLEKYPEYIEKFMHLNVLVPSRTLIPRYELLNREIETLIEHVNFKYATATWQPIHVIKDSLNPSELYPLYKSANLMMVTALADGMNLTAKEYVAAGPDDGVLILSERAGAADDLKDAVIVNPYDIEQMADLIKVAIEMPKDERKQRIAKMREQVNAQNLFEWAGKFLNDISEINSHEELHSDLPI